MSVLANQSMEARFVGDSTGRRPLGGVRGNACASGDAVAAPVTWVIGKVVVKVVR